MPPSKLKEKDLKDIKKLLEKGISAKDIAKKYGVDRSTIYNRVKYRHQGKKIPIETKNKVIKAIKDGLSLFSLSSPIPIGSKNMFLRR